MLWNGLGPELWRRTTIALQRALARLVGVQEAELRQVVQVSYAKVPSSNAGARSTSTPSCAWTRPPTAGVLALWRHHQPASRRPPSRTVYGRPSRL